MCLLVKGWNGGNQIMAAIQETLDCWSMVCGHTPVPTSFFIIL
jgi:hypothetical protein